MSRLTISTPPGAAGDRFVATVPLLGDDLEAGSLVEPASRVVDLRRQRQGRGTSFTCDPLDLGKQPTTQAQASTPRIDLQLDEVDAGLRGLEVDGGARQGPPSGDQRCSGRPSGLRSVASHVHVYKDGEYLIDDTFGTVIYQGETLERTALFDAMVANTVN